MTTHYRWKRPPSRDYVAETRLAAEACLREGRTCSVRNLLRAMGGSGHKIKIAQAVDYLVEQGEIPASAVPPRNP
jgi:hypothetical protein